MHYIIDPPPVSSVPVSGSDGGHFPVGRVFCVGRNYADHAIEMGGNPDAEPPFFFMKPASAVTTGNADFPYPPLSNDVHHEVEFVVALGGGGIDVPVANALALVVAYGVGIDMTRRDLQGEAKATGRPWEAGKAFEASAPCSDLVPVATCGHPDAGAITLTINGELRQSGDLNQLIWKVPEIISRLSASFTLAPGDLIYTGTPAGVGPVLRGDTIVAEVAGLARLETRVT